MKAVNWQSCLIILVLLLAGMGIGWSTRPFLDHAGDYREAERVQGVISLQGKNDPELASNAMEHAGKLVLRAANGDPVMIVNPSFQLRLGAGRTFPSIERLGTQ